MTFAGWAEIGAIALLTFIIIGPKDLPKVLFTLGRAIGTLKRLSQDFNKEFQDMDPLQDPKENHHQK